MILMITIITIIIIIKVIIGLVGDTVYDGPLTSVLQVCNYTDSL